MRKFSLNFWRAYLTLVGTVIGAGIFGVPYVYSRAGTLLGVVETAAIGGLLALLYLMFAETLLRTEEPSRLPGLTRRYFGKNWGDLAAVTQIIGFWAALLAYLLLGGAFLQIIFGRLVNLPEVYWQIGFYLLAAAVVAGGLKVVGRAEAWVTAVLLLSLIYFLWRLSPHVSIANFSLVNPAEAWLPWGVVLFALAGTAAVPTMRSILRGQENRLRPAILWGSLTSILATLAFGLVVSGVAGAATGERAIDGLVNVAGPWVVGAGALFGLLAIATSFFANGLYLRDIFRVDYKISRSLAAALALLPPVLAFSFGAQKFIVVIGLAGAFFGAFDTALLCLCYLAARREGRRRPEVATAVPVWVVYLMMAIFAAGFALTLLAR